MKRLLMLCLAIVAALVIVASSSAAKSGQGNGVISAGGLMHVCAFGGTTSDGQLVYAGGANGLLEASFQFLGGTSFFGPDVGWICEGTTFFTGALPPITGALVITGLTCLVPGGPHWTGVTGTLASPGTAILFPGGRFRLICPPSEVTPFPSP